MSSLPFQLIQPSFLRNPTSSQNAINGKKKLNRQHSVSLPELFLQNSQQELAQTEDFINLEGVTTNVKLILKLLQDHNDSSKEDDGGNPRRLTRMLEIVDEIRSGIELCSKRAGPRKPGLCRCNTDRLRGHHPTSPTSNRYLACTAAFSTSEESENLRRELSASMAARKSLERMFSSLGREKELIAGELARRVQELGCMEELVGDLRAENNLLADKMRVCAAEHRGYGNRGNREGEKRGSS